MFQSFRHNLGGFVLEFGGREEDLGLTVLDDISQLVRWKPL
jgi:hypothetical protein